MTNSSNESNVLTVTQMIRINRSNKEIVKSSKLASEAFNIDEEQAEDVDNFRETFKDIRDLRAVLEDYFHIYDDYAEMTPEEFNKSFAEFVKDDEEESNILEYPEE